tara:strand:+ start:1436 stop:2404 length:969 start_codon:yes stop_codon:yes gene_type:complete
MQNEYPLSIGRSNILGTETFRNLLGESLRSSKKRVIILSAYVKKIGISWLEDQLKGKEIDCTIISRWQKGDLATGSSDLECYTLCKENNWKFKILNDLHAKVMLIDNKDLFIGSPNLTGSGMSLIPVSNKELGIKIEAITNDIKTIDGLVEDAILVDDEIYNDLKKWKIKLPEINKPSIPEYPESLKNKLKENFNKIWVHNFLWSTVEELLNINKINSNVLHDIQLLGLKENEINLENLKEAFIKSKIYKWLINQLMKKNDKEIYFGELSETIANSLLDDPKPFRKNIKILQSNLYSFLNHLNLENIEISIPKKKSQRLKLI